MATVQQGQYQIKENFVKLVSKPHHKRQPSIIIDSPTESYFAGSNISYGNSSQIRQSICSSAETIDTPTTSSFQSTKASFFSQSQKLIKNQALQNFTQYIDALKGIEAKKQIKQQQITKKSILQKNQLSTRISEIQEKNNEILDSSDDEEYSIWDNSQLESQGFDCQNFQNVEGKDFTFYQLYRMRQAQLLGNISRRATINEVFTIAEHYNQPVKKTELVKQQQYLEDNYKIESQVQIQPKQTQSAQQLDQSEFEMVSPNKTLRHRQQISSSIEKINQITQQNQQKKNQSIFDKFYAEQNTPTQQLNYYMKSPKSLIKTDKQQIFSHQQSLPVLSKNLNQNNFRQSKQLFNLKISEQKLISQSSIFAQTQRNPEKKYIQITYINPNNQNENTPQSSKSSYQKLQNSSQSTLSFPLQNSPILTKEQRMKIIQKKIQNKFNEERAKISQLSLLKKQKFVKDQSDSPTTTQPTNSQTSQSPNQINYMQQSLQKQSSYCDIAKFKI